MKILKEGCNPHYKFVCPVCGCVYIVKNGEDYEGGSCWSENQYKTSWFKTVRTIFYRSHCPNCDHLCDSTTCVDENGEDI